MGVGVAAKYAAMLRNFSTNYRSLIKLKKDVSTAKHASNSKVKDRWSSRRQSSIWTESWESGKSLR